MTLNELLKEGETALADAGVAEAGIDAWYLFSRAFGLDRVHFLMDKNLPVAEGAWEEAKSSYQEMIKRRAQRVPLQHILGDQEFMGLTFAVNEHVLVPRQDTETLVEWVLKDYSGAQPKVLDMCTGSGCIAVSLAKLGGFSHVDAADISREALLVAKKNAAFNGCDIHFKESDLFCEIEETYDVIVSNPPYIASAEILSLEPEVREHEPMLALDGSSDGLSFYRRLAAECGRYLPEGGRVYFEIGCSQSAAVTALLKENGFTQIETAKDAAGMDRVVKAVWKR